MSANTTPRPVAQEETYIALASGQDPVKQAAWIKWADAIGVTQDEYMEMYVAFSGGWNARATPQAEAGAEGEIFDDWFNASSYGDSPHGPTRDAREEEMREVWNMARLSALTELASMREALRVAVDELRGVTYNANGRGWGYYGTYRGVQVVISEDRLSRMNAALTQAEPLIAQPATGSVQK